MGQPGRPRALLSLRDRLLRDVYRNDVRAGAVSGKRYGLCADAASGLKNTAACRIARVAMEKINQGFRLIL